MHSHRDPPTGGLLNASYAWGPPTYSTQPVTIADQATAAVTITNHVLQKFGTFSLTKVVSGPPGGYTGGHGRVFPVSYSCTLTNGPTTTGTLNLTVAQAVSPSTPIPAGSVCTLTETLTNNAGDFSDPSYVWTGFTVSPTTVTIGDGTTANVTMTNTYIRQFGSLTIAKVVSGAGYIGAREPFTVGYDCGSGFGGTRTVAAGGSVTIPGLPAGVTCEVRENPPLANLLDPAHVWGTPTWSPGRGGGHSCQWHATLTVTNPTTPIFGRVSVTKAVTGATGGVRPARPSTSSSTVGWAALYPFDLAAGDTATTPDVPVGTPARSARLLRPAGSLTGRTPGGSRRPRPQTVTITSANQVVAVTVTNTVQRVRGQLTITKAGITPSGVVDPARTFAIGYSCVYGNDVPIAGVVNLLPGASQTVGPFLLNSNCTVTEDPATLTAPPSALIRRGSGCRSPTHRPRRSW